MLLYKLTELDLLFGSEVENVSGPNMVVDTAVSEVYAILEAVKDLNCRAFWESGVLEGGFAPHTHRF